jgi:hypothetical protein
MDNLITPEGIVKLKKNIAKLRADLKRPIDFNKLIKDGILSKKGAWYEVHDWERLPEHARYQIKEMMGGADTKTLVKFRKGKSSTE